MQRSSNEMAASHGFYASTAIEQNDRDPEIARAVVRAQAGDMEAIRFLYLRYKNNVYGYVLSILRDAHEAEDATQHVFMKLISVIHKYRAASGAVHLVDPPGGPQRRRRLAPSAPARRRAMR